MQTKTILLAWTILPGKEETWRRFVQEIQEIHLSEYAESRRNLGIRKECIHIATAIQAPIAITTIEAEDPERLLLKWSEPEQPFDHWFKRQVLELHGVDLTLPEAIPAAEPVLMWRASGLD